MAKNVQVTTLIAFDGRTNDVAAGDPVGVAVDRAGHAIVVDARNNCVIKVISNRSATTVTTVLGEGNEGSDQKAVFAGLQLPIGVAIDHEGNAIVADAHNHCIRKITPTCTVVTIAGGANARFAPASIVNETSSDFQDDAFTFSNPRAVAVDSQGNVIVADTYMHRIRKIDLNGTATTMAGSGNAGYADGKGIGASFNYPAGVAVDGDGNVLVADTYNDRIRKISKDGTVSTLAGSMSASMRDGHRFAASFNCPRGLAIDGDGNLVVADSGNHSIRMVSPDGTVTTLAGTGKARFSDGPVMAAGFSDPYDVAIDFDGNVLVADTGNKRLRLINAGLNPPERKMHQKRIFYTLVALRQLINTDRASLILAAVPGISLAADSNKHVLSDLQKFLTVLKGIPTDVIRQIALLL